MEEEVNRKTGGKICKVRVSTLIKSFRNINRKGKERGHQRGNGKKRNLRR